jgi:hypothetical protein
MEETLAPRGSITSMMPLKTLRDVFKGREDTELERSVIDPVCFSVDRLIVGRLTQFKAELTPDMRCKEDFLVIFDDWPHSQCKLVIEKVNCFNLWVHVVNE